MEYEDVRCIAVWLFQWLALGLSIPGLLFGWAVIAWSCFLFLVGALVLGGISPLFSLCSHYAVKQSKWSPRRIRQLAKKWVIKSCKDSDWFSSPADTFQTWHVKLAMVKLPCIGTEYTDNRCGSVVTLLGSMIIWKILCYSTVGLKQKHFQLQWNGSCSCRTVSVYWLMMKTFVVSVWCDLHTFCSQWRVLVLCCWV